APPRPRACPPPGPPHGSCGPMPPRPASTPPAAATHLPFPSRPAADPPHPPVPGRAEVRAAGARVAARRTGLPVEPENVIVCAGAQNGLFNATLCLVEAGDEVLVPEPMYLTYEACVRASGATLVPVAPDAATLRLDPAALAAALPPSTRALFLATPATPSGIVMSMEELEAVADLARRHDLWVVADEVYASLTFDRPHIGIATLPGMAERTVTINSLSKSHAMTGWRAGWVVAPAPLVAHMGTLALCMLYGLPGFVQQAALVAVEQGDEAAAAMREGYRRRPAIPLEAPGSLPRLRCLKPEARKFMRGDGRGPGLPPLEFSGGRFPGHGGARVRPPALR
ncbi:aminotransferase class I/II-fold pyridoxal phosphate-dependent enzyme, partial [Azospirillum brasilense]|nr:aminotransferase class I/II-fold pyridoxal phosphate-dependent enzyme [Azospirillum brasilense]